MATPDKIEAVKKVNEMLNQKAVNPAEELERVSPNRDHFQSLMSNTANPVQSSFQVVDSSMGPEGVQNVENNPILGDESVSSQKSGSATDQDRKQKGHSEVEGVEETSGVKKKAASSTSLMDEVQKLHTKSSTIGQLSPENLKKQAKEVIAQIDHVKTQLSQVQDIKPSYQTLMRNRLTHIDDNLKIALSKAGVEYTPQVSATGASTGTPSPAERFINMLTNSQHQLEHLGQSIEQLGMSGEKISPANMLAMQLKVNYVQQQVELFTSLLNKALESMKTIMNVQV